MALNTTIVVNLGSGSLVLTSDSSGTPVETISFDATANQFSIAARSDANIPAQDFLSFVDQINIFNTAISFNYNPNIFATVPFNLAASEELNDIVNNQWNLICLFGGSSFDYVDILTVSMY